MYDINSIDELVDALGGPKAIATWLGISQAAVSLWKSRGHIPPGWHIRLYAAALRRGKSVNPAVFGIDPQDMAPLALMALRPDCLRAIAV
jgi:hypothetical protein